MIRHLLLIAASILVIAASPAEDARKLIERGKVAEAFSLVERAANAGDPAATDYLAWFYDIGQHVPKDQTRAAKLYRTAAEAGDRHAQWRLGVMLDMGEGIPANPAEAFAWISKAAAQGSPKGHASLGVMYAMGRGVPVDLNASMQHYLEAARLGESHGFFGVGILYARGEGRPADLTEALAWMLIASSVGDEEATKLIDSNAFRDADGPRATARGNEIAIEFGLNVSLKFEGEERPKNAELDSGKSV